MALRKALLLTLALGALAACGGRTDRAAEARARLDLTYRLELAGVPADDDLALDRLNRKYAVLHGALEEELRDGPRLLAPPISYTPKEVAAVKEVFSAYGDLYVGPETAEVKIDPRPWSGYWYPLARTDLYGAPDAPLVKLDQLAASLGKAGGTAQWEKTRHDHGIPAGSWEGFCSALAVAAVTSPEPLRTLDYKGISFTPGDQKALLTKAHELYPARQFGIRYDGDRDTDGTYQDLRPEAFHRLVQQVIGAQRQPLVFDTDPGVEVWSKPLYRMRWVTQADPDHADAFLVAAYPWFVKERPAPSDAPTGDSDVLTSVFQYRIYVDRQTQRDGKYLAVAGEWLGDSLDAHPDYALVPAVNGAWGSSNPALNGALDVVRELFEKGTPR